jgi:hypothetical protein
MTHRFIDPRSILKLQYPNVGGYTLITVEGDQRFNAYVFNEVGLQWYEGTGEVEQALRASKNQTRHQILLEPMDTEITAKWYLVFDNPNQSRLHVNMSVMHPTAVRTYR